MVYEGKLQEVGLFSLEKKRQRRERGKEFDNTLQIHEGCLKREDGNSLSFVAVLRQEQWHHAAAEEIHVGY